MDYGDFIIHLFDADSRAYYDLERIWRDAKSYTDEEFLHSETLLSTQKRRIHQIRRFSTFYSDIIILSVPVSPGF